MSIFKYLTLSHLQKVLSVLEVRFKGIENNINDVKNDINTLPPIPTDYKKNDFIITIKERFDSETNKFIYYSDKTFREIFDAIGEGKTIYGSKGHLLSASFFEDGTLYFDDVINLSDGTYGKDIYKADRYIFYDNDDYDIDAYPSVERIDIEIDGSKIKVDADSLRNQKIFEGTFTPEYNNDTEQYEINIINNNLWDKLVNSGIYSRYYDVTINNTTTGVKCKNKSLNVSPYFIQANSDNTVLITSNSGDTITIEIWTTWVPVVTVHPDYLRSFQSDWEEDDMGNTRYIDHRPTIRAGNGENSIVEGQIEQEDSYDTYTILVSGEANATSYTFTTTDTITSNYWLYVAEYNNDYYAVMELSGEPTINIITFHKTLSTETALTNEPILLHYKRKDAVGKNSSAEGHLTWSIGSDSHAEGYLTRAIGANGSHAEGFRTQSKGACAHAEGMVSLSLNMASHSEGSFTVAKNNYSHAEGWYTIASSNSQHVQGKYNIEDSTSTYAHIVGNGTSLSARSNAHTLDWSGNGWYAGKLTVGTGPVNNMDVVTKLYVDTLANDKQPKRLVVTVTSTYDETTDENTYSADKTFTEVQTAMNEGRTVYFDYYGRLSEPAYDEGPNSNYIYADIPGNAHSQLIYSSNGIEIGYDYSYYRKADKGTIGGDLREVDEGTKMYQTAQYAHSKDDILWVMSDVGFDSDMYVAKSDIAVGDELSPGNTGNLQAITVEGMIDMKIAASSSSVSCATMAEIEEMCDALGFMSVTIDTSDYEAING